MRYRTLGNTGLEVSEIGLGGEWLERHNTEEVRAVIDRCADHGINILDCWMSEPKVRSNIGAALEGRRDKWIIQGHVGSTWQNGQFVRSREFPIVKEAFEDLLHRLRTDYIDLGMIFFVDSLQEYEEIMHGSFLEFMQKQKSQGHIRHIGMSSHNPEVALRAAESGIIEVLLFAINPAFDMMPPTDNIDNYFVEEYDAGLSGIDPKRAELYKVCDHRGVGLTVMKGYGGGRLLKAETSPFGVALTPVQCLHYALTRPAVASVMVGCDTPGEVDAAVAYETSTPNERDYASVLAGAPKHAYSGQCTYCGHCQPCPADIDIAMVNKLFDLATMQENVPATVRAHYEALSAHASDCLQCGECESRCPFEVSVREYMQKAAALFGF